MKNLECRVQNENSEEEGTNSDCRYRGFVRIAKGAAAA
jgi:hypothetical protein